MRLERLFGALFVVFLVLAVVNIWTYLRAQATLLPQSYIVRVYPSVDTATFQVFTFPVTEIMCNELPYEGALVIPDPIKLEWADRGHPGRVCVWQGLNRILPPPGLYEVTLSMVNRAGVTSVESARAPFMVTQAVDVDVPASIRVYR